MLILDVNRMSSIRQSHPFFKNRINKYSVNKVKTWVDMENHNDYSDIDNIGSREGFSIYRNTQYEYNSSIIINRESELEGLYCEDIKLVYLNYKNADPRYTCHNIVWFCHDCDICKSRRQLDIMKKIYDKFDACEDLEEFNMYQLVIKNFSKQGMTSSKIIKKLRYRQKGLGQLLHTINEEYDMITFVLEGEFKDLDLLGLDGVTQTKISKDEVLKIVGMNNKYRFLGKFHAQIPAIKAAGITPEELDELTSIKPYKSDNCKCGNPWSDHVKRQASAWELYNLIQPADHYKKGHELFKKKHFAFWEKDNIGVAS